MEEIESHEDRFMLNIDTDLPSLLEISSYTVARSIWDNYISRTKPSPSSTIPYYNNAQQFLGLNDNFLEDCDKMVDSLQTPTSIEKILKNSLNHVAKEMFKWHSKLYWTTGVFVRDPNYVLFANGKLDCKSSIIQISAGNRLSDVQKFALMSKFCLEDEIVKFPLDSLPSNFLERTNFPDGPFLIRYWFYYAKNELHKIPRSPDSDFSLFGELALKCNSGHWVAFEYFWNRMDSNEQMLVVTTILDRFSLYFWPLDRFLSLMSGPQQRRLFSANPTRIIFKCFRYIDSVKSLRWIWTHYENSVTDHIFVEIIKSLFQSDRMHVEEWMSWLVNLWDAASEQRKIYAVQHLGDIPLNNYANSIHRPLPLAEEFLCKFLSMLDADSRKHMMLENATFFQILMFDPNSISKLMDLCLPDVDDRAKFKKRFIECDITKYRCVYLICEKDFDELNTVLEFCLPTSNDVRIFKKTLLESHAVIFPSTYFLYQVKKWNALCKFINEVDPEDDTFVLQTKKRLIKLYLNKYFPSNVYGGTVDVTQMIQIVESELTEDELNPLKYSLFHSFEFKLKTNKCCYGWYRHYLNEMYFHQFVKWCVGDDDGVVLKYGDGTFIDTVFYGVLSVLVEPFSYGQRRYLQFDEPLLFNLNQFLLWHLISEEKVKEYKVRRISKDLKIVKRYSQSNESTSLEVLLKWFFGDDELAICEFKSKCNFT